MRAGLLALAIGAAGFAAGWFVALDRIPYIATDRMFAGMRASGFETNVLRPPRLRGAKRNLVPMDNADTLTRAAILDLSAGPLLFTATPPGDAAEYWSVSVFAHNTDTVFVRNDTEIGAGGTFRLGIRLRDQAMPPGAADAEAVLPSETGFLIVRATMTDRTDAKGVERLKAALEDHTLNPVAEAPAPG